MSRDFISGILGPHSNFRVEIEGEVGVREIDNLIALLRLQQKILRGEDPPQVRDESGNVQK